MSFRYKCANCGVSLKIKPEKVGTSSHCPGCKVAFTVPDPSTLEPDGSARSTVSHMAATDGNELAEDAANETSARTDEISSAPSDHGHTDDEPPMFSASDAFDNRSQLKTTRAEAAFDGSSDLSEGDSGALDNDSAYELTANAADSGSSSALVESSSSDSSQLLSESAPEVKPAKGRGKKSGKFSEDDIDAILSGDGPGLSAPAQAPVSVPRGGFGDAGVVVPRREVAARSSIGDDLEAGSVSPSVAASKAMTDLFAGNARKEEARRSKGKPFGGPANEGEPAGYDVSETIKAHVPKIAGIIIGTILVSYFLYSTMTSMLGGVKHPPLERVYGTVTLNGQPLPNAEVLFYPILEGGANRSKSDMVSGSIGRTDAAGNYTLSYAIDAPGAVIGKNYVSISATDMTGTPLVPRKYNAESELIIEVRSGEPKIDFPLTTQ